MANEFVARNGVIALNNTQVTGSFNVSGSSKFNGDVTITGSLSLSGSGVITGYTQYLPVSTNIDNSISSSYIYVSGSTQDLYFTQNSAGYANTTRLRWIESNLYTGLLSGGVISASLGSTSFSITSGSAIIVTLNASTASVDPYPTVKQVYWNTQTQPLLYSASAKITYIGISNTGQIVQQTVPWGSLNIDQFDTEVEIGVVLHLSGSKVTGVYNTPQVSYGYAQQTDDFIRAFGPIKISGHTLQASGSAPTLSIIKTGGTAYNKGANYVNNANHPSTVTDPAFNISKIYRYYISGSTPVIDSGVGGAGYTEIDNKNYVDTTTGTLATVGASNWSIQRVFWIPNSPTNAFLVYYGNARYGTLVNAVNAKDSEAFTEAPNTAQNAIFLGYIIIQGGGSGTPPRDLNNSNETAIIPGGLFRSVGGVGSSGTAPVSNTLAGLSDVAIASPSVGDLLVYGTGTQWNNNKALSGSYSLTGSLGITGNITAQTLVVQTITSSTEYSSGSNRFGNDITNTQTFTGSVGITGSLIMSGSSTFTGDMVVGISRLLGVGSGNSATIRMNNAANGSYIDYAGTQIRLVQNTNGSLVIGSNFFKVDSISLAAAGGAIITLNQSTATSGNLIGSIINTSYSQSSGTAANTDFLVNRTQTVVGSGAQYLIEARTNNISQFNVSNVGGIVANSMYISGSASGSLFVSGSTSLSGSLNVSGNITTTGTLTAQTLVVQTVTSSIIYSSGSNIFGNKATDNQVFTGSVLISGSITVSGSVINNLTASYAQTASYVIPLRQAVIITGSLIVSSSNANTASLSLIGTGSGVFTVDGTSGRLFSVDDSLSGSLFSVNTAAGLPVIEAFSDNTVRIGKYGTRVLYVSQSAVGIGKETALNGILDISGSATITGSLLLSTGSMFGLPTTSSLTPVTGSMFWSGSLLFIYNGTRYMSASFA